MLPHHTTHHGTSLHHDAPHARIAPESEGLTAVILLALKDDNTTGSFYYFCVDLSFC